MFQLVFWGVFAGTAIWKDDVYASQVATIPLVGNIIKAYAQNVAYTTRCFIFGGLIGAHMGCRLKK